MKFPWLLRGKTSPCAPNSPGAKFIVLVMNSQQGLHWEEASEVPRRESLRTYSLPGAASNTESHLLTVSV